jgi:hypothetical protein
MQQVFYVLALVCLAAAILLSLDMRRLMKKSAQEELEQVEKPILMRAVLRTVAVLLGAVLLVLSHIMQR